MPIEPLRCKVCGGMLDANLKCQHCGTLHQKIENRLEIIKVCPKHLIGYSASECPKCVEEQQALILYNQEQARLSAEKEEALRKERLRRNEQTRLDHEQWKKSNYPKLKKLSVVALLCLIIGAVGLCVSPIYYTVQKGVSSPYTVISNNGLNISLTMSGISILSPTSQTYALHIIDSYSEMAIGCDGCCSGTTANMIPFDRLLKGGEYSITGTPVNSDDSSIDANVATVTASFSVNYIPTSTELYDSIHGITTENVNGNMTNLCLFEILLIVIGVLILVAVTIVVFAKTSYELEVETP